MLYFYDSLDALGMTDEDFMDDIEPSERPESVFNDVFPPPSPDELGIYADLPF